MRYFNWAVFYEGISDALYFNILIPRLVRDILKNGPYIVEIPETPAVRVGMHDRSVDAVAREACDFQEAFDVIFIHADTDGRARERNVAHRTDAYCVALGATCAWPADRCVVITPRHETEAWLLADGAAVTHALGYDGGPDEIGLPATARAAERLADPEAKLAEVMNAVSGRRRRPDVETIFPAIAQRQKLERLRASASFRDFEDRLRSCLQSMHLLQ